MEQSVNHRVKAALTKLSQTLIALKIKDVILASPAYLKQYEPIHELTYKLPGNDLLDWGAGYGHFTYVQAIMGKNVTAYSPVEDEYTIYPNVLNDLAKIEPFKVDFTTEPIKLPYDINSFDIAVSCGVLEHVREFGGDDVASLKELYRVLKNNGHLVIAHLPNKSSWIETLNKRLGRSHHAFTYRFDEVKEKVTSAGFEIVTHRRYGLIPKNTFALLSRRFDDKNALVMGLVNTLHGLDKGMSRLLPLFSQNHLVIARKVEKI